jgi:hypothetical protein
VKKATLMKWTIVPPAAEQGVATACLREKTAIVRSVMMKLMLDSGFEAFWTLPDSEDGHSIPEGSKIILRSSSIEHRVYYVTSKHGLIEEDLYIQGVLGLSVNGRNNKEEGPH